ncbi:MAG: CarD family transcriptional regulator [Methylobacteriaceae bacterium]|jgi:CarD family transcriptional regulator|nr:CarD family transcriptional regulator [Methylobacteriaceae bacterium]
MASLKKSSKKSKAGASARKTAKARSLKRSAAVVTKRTVAKAVASPSARSRKSATAAGARARQPGQGTAKTSGKSAQKSAIKAARAGTSKSKAAARRNIERKTTTVEMRNKKTASAQKAGAARAKTTTHQPTTSRRAVAKPAKAASVTKATKITGTVKTVKPVETIVDKVKEVSVRTMSTAKTAAAPVTEAPRAAKTAAKAPPAKAAANPETAAAKAAGKPENSASTILLETIRRVGQAAAAEAKARVVAPVAAAVTSVVSAPAAEPVKAAAPAAAPAPGAMPASGVPAAAPARPAFGGPSGMGRPGYPGDSRLHQLQPRPVAKPGSPRPSFKLEEFIVYPAHGVGQIVAIEEQEVAGFKLELYVISFAKDKMTLKVPTPKVVSVGMRKLAEPALVQKALDVLTGRARIKRTMWSRRAQEYEAKINSGDLIAIAEVIRDLYRSEAQPEQSYSERQLYEAALDRMGREIGAVQKLTETETLKVIDTQLQKGPRRGVKPEGEGEGEAASEVEEAAA